MAGAVQQPEVTAGKMKVFISYSRRDVAFAGELKLALEDKGYVALVDHEEIDPNDTWKERLGQLIFSCDTVVFVLSEHSAGSPVCAWEVKQAARASKRMLVVTQGPVPPDVQPPQHLSDAQWIPCWRNPDVPDSSFMRGVIDLDRALKTDLAWLRQLTRLQEQAEIWAARALAYRPVDGVVDRSSSLLRGNILAEAIAWREAKPADASVPTRVESFIAASEEAEAAFKAENAAQLAEREAAVKAAERANRRAGLLAWVAIGVALVLSTIAVTGGWFALTNFIRSSQSRADLVVREADALYARGEYSAGALAALQADPAADAGLFGAMIWPDGYPPMREAMARNITASPFLSRSAQLETRLVEGIRAVGKGEWAVHVGRGSVVRLNQDLTQVLSTSPPLTELGDYFAGSLSTDGSLLAANLPDEIRVVRLNDQSVVASIPMGKPDINLLEPDRRVMFTSDLSELLVFAKGELSSWKLADVSARDSFATPFKTVREAELSPNGQLIAVRDDATVAILPRRMVGVRAQKAFGNVAGMAWSPAGDVLAVIVVSPAGQAELQYLSVDRLSLIQSVAINDEAEWGCVAPAFSADGATIVIACEGQLLRYRTPWSTQETVMRVAGRDEAPVLGARYEMEDLYRDMPRFSKDGEQLLLIAPDGRVDVYQTRDGATLSAGYDVRAKEALLSEDGTMFSAPIGDGYALFSVRDGGRLASFDKLSWDYGKSGFLDGDAGLVGPLQDGGIGVWSLKGGSPDFTYPAEVGDDAWHTSGDGKRVVAWTLNGAEVVKVWEGGKPQPIAELKLTPGDITMATLSRDGRRVVTASEEEVKLWDVDERKVVADLSRKDVDFGNVVLSPDRKSALLGWQDGLNVLISLETGEEIARFDPDPGFRGGARFSADGRMFVTDGDVLKVWSSTSRKPLAELSSSLGDRARVVFAPDEKSVLVWSNNSRLVRVPIPPIVFDSKDAQVAAACGLLEQTGIRDFSDEQWQQIGILDRKAPHPCANMWGFDPRKGETAPVAR